MSQSRTSEAPVSKPPMSKLPTVQPPLPAPGISPSPESDLPLPEVSMSGFPISQLPMPTLPTTEQLQQGTAEWLAARCGKVTASRVADVVARTKTGWSASRVNYAAELIAERLTGEPAPGFTSAAMQWGIDQEALAREAYIFLTGETVTETGFVRHPTIVQSGASPDGLVGSDGLVEIKCPNTATHIDTLIAQVVPQKYMTQMLWQMACTGRQWCDFVSFDPRLPDHLQLFVRRVERNEETIRMLEQEVICFIAEEVDRRLVQLAQMSERVAA